MNWWKKMRKIAPLLSVGLILIAFVIAIMISINKGKEMVISCFKNYNVSSYVFENDDFDVLLYCNNDESYFVDEKQIVNAYLSDEKENNTLTLKINAISKTMEYINYENDKYNMFLFNFSIPTNFSDEYYWYLENAFLNIDFLNQKKFKILIGNFSYNKYNKNINHDLSISLIKPLIFDEEMSYLGGVIYKVNNNSSSDFNVKKIEILNCGVIPGDDVKITQLSDTINFNDVSGYEHEYVKAQKDELNILIRKGREEAIFLPLYYDKLFSLQNFPIKITYEKDGKQYSYIFENYSYYKPIKEIINDYYVYQVS